jgi:cytochrome c556
MLRVVSLVAALAVGGTFAYAQNLNVIKERKESMKAVGGAAGVGGKMMKGEEKFDLAKVQASLKTYEEQAVKQKALYPDDSKTGGETEALPAVFEKKADFLARFDKFASDAKAGAAAIKDEASFKAEWPKVMANCGGCHKEYRKPKQ